MEVRYQRVERFFEWPVLIAALLVIPVMVIEGSNVDEPWDAIADLTNWGIWLVFAAELVTLLALTPDKGRWVRKHPLEVAIVVLTPPFLPASLQALRVFRLARVLRLARLAPLARRLFTLEGLRWAGLVAVLTLLGGGAAFTAIEKGSNDEVQHTWDGVWWCFASMTTVGSEIQPTTHGGRILAIVVVLVGVSFIAFLTGAIARRFIEPRFEEVEEEVEQTEEDLAAQLRQITDQLQRVERALSRRE